MATLETIRNKAGVLITVFIGLALVAFILTDLFTPGKSILSGNANEVAIVNGNSISYEQFEASLNRLEEWTKMQYQRSSLDENTTNRLFTQNWDQVIRESIMNDQYENLGITFTDKEMAQMFAASTAHQAIRQMFTNPQTGAYDEFQAMESYKNRAGNPQANFYWDYLLDQIKLETLTAKYTALISKGLYTTSSQINELVAAKKTTFDFDYILKPYTSIADSTISVKDSEIKAYYNKHINDYKREATRDVKYLTFEVVPSDDDNSATKENVVKAKIRFENPETDAVAFINRNSDNAPYIAKNEKFDAIKPLLQDFASTAKEGDVYGPYYEDESYKLTKLIAIKQLPDSVKARHILIRAETPNSDKIADSLFTIAKSGSDFAALARANSEDTGSGINGGDLGWFEEGKMVKEFNEACFAGKKGDIVKIKSQFGFHIINIQDKGKAIQKYELATFEKKVLASQRTRQNVYSTVTKFATENETPEKFDASIKEQNLTPRFGNGLKANDRRVGNLESPRQLVKWAFSAEVGETSPILELGNQFVIALLVKANDSEYADIADVKAQIKAEILNDKKAEILIADINGAIKESQSLSSVAQKMNVQVQSATAASFATAQVKGAGFAPALAALASQSEKDQISVPVQGARGVYVVKVTGSTENTVDENAEKATLAQELNYKVYRAYDAIKKNSEIEDNRSNFY